MKKLILLIVLSGFYLSSHAQVNWALKAGAGTSWLAFPKVFLVDPTNVENTWEIAPATNSGTFYVGAEMIIPVGDHMAFRAELSYNYVSGEVNVDQLETDPPQQARKLQAYNRVEVPLLFTVRSDDSFWFSLGPAFFITLSDNKGFEEAVNALAPNAIIDSSVPIGIRARLATNIQLDEHLFLEVKFDYDLGKHFEYIGSTYEVRMAMQGLTGGLTYVF
jgi:hypothetical protein